MPSGSLMNSSVGTSSCFLYLLGTLKILAREILVHSYSILLVTVNNAGNRVNTWVCCDAKYYQC